MTTVTVRIAVAVGTNGAWSCVGANWAGDEDDSVGRAALNQISGQASLFWVTATLPIPEPVEVEGKVET